MELVDKSPDAVPISKQMGIYQKEINQAKLLNIRQD